MSFSLRPKASVTPRWADLLVALLVALAALIVALASAPAARARTGVDMGAFPPGTIVVRQSERRLYLGLRDGEVVSYPVAVGKAGKQWRGFARVDGKYVNPAWAPPAEVKRAEPWLPDYIPGGASNNPMGHRALTLTGGEYAIHGTNRPWTVGTAASFGCIRMREADIDRLFDEVEVGTPVVMLP
jgi:lipoprotein-anchoring transpeptidase ErfK/SrfK